MSGGRRTVLALSCLWAAVYAALGERMLLDVGIGGGRGLLAYGALVSALLLPVIVVATPRDRMTTPATWKVDPPVIFLGVAALLPLLGIAFGYPVRTVIAAAVPLASLSFLLLGRWLARESLSGALRTTWLALTAIAWLQASTAVVQTLYWRHVVLPGAPALIAWDQAVANLMGTLLITGRSAGLYTNPNVLSLMAGIGLVFGVTAPLRASQRALLVVPGAIALGLGQSRGVMAALIAATAVELLVLLAAGRLRPRVTGYVAGGLAFLGGAFVLLRRFAPEQTARLVGRLTSAVSSTSPGGAVDTNLGGRLAFWEDAAVVLGRRPLGTFGPPESVLGAPTDSDLVRLTLQGGVILVGLYAWALGWLVHGSVPALRSLVRSLVVLVAVTSLTMNTSTYPPAIFGAWIVFGIVSARLECDLERVEPP